MTAKKKTIRQSFKSILDANITGKRITSNRAYEHTDFPSINIVSGSDDPTDEGFAGNQQSRVYSLIAEIRVASDNHDDDTDDISEEIKALVKANRKLSGVWSFSYVGSYGEVESEAGDVVYSMTPMEIIFMYED